MDICLGRGHATLFSAPFWTGRKEAWREARGGRWTAGSLHAFTLPCGQVGKEESCWAARRALWQGRSWGGTEEMVLEPRPPCQRSGQQVGPTQGASGPVQAGQREEMLNSKRTSMAAARVREAGLLPSSPQHAKRGKPRGVEKGGAPGPCPLCALRRGYSEISGFVPKVQKL